MTEAEVLEALRAARAAGRRVRVSGAGTTARPPRDGAVALSLAGHRGIVALRPDDGVVSVRAGTPLADVAAALGESRRRLPLAPWDPQARGTVGGAVAAAADGLAARGGFRWRDHVLGVRAALPSGEVVEAGAKVVKSVAGFDVPRLMVGAGGSVAVILLLHLRIEPEPEGEECWFGEDEREWRDALDVASHVAHDLRGAVLSDGGRAGSVRLDLRVAGRSPARALLDAGLHRCAPALWTSLTALASAPPPAGLHRRVGRPDPAGPARRVGAQRSGGWVADLLRGRTTWIDVVPPPPPEPATRALAARVRRAFDPDEVLDTGGRDA